MPAPAARGAAASLRLLAVLPLGDLRLRPADFSWKLTEYFLSLPRDRQPDLSGVKGDVRRYVAVE